MPEFDVCPKHNRYECQEIDGKPIHTCGACELDRLQVAAHMWFSNLPSEKKAVYIRRDKIRALHQRKVMWSFFTGVAFGFGAGAFIVTNDVPHRVICLIGVLLSNIGLSYLCRAVTKKITVLEQERDTWEVEQMRRT